MASGEKRYETTLIFYELRMDALSRLGSVEKYSINVKLKRASNTYAKKIIL